MAQSGKLTPNLDQQSTKILNLTVLQRIDPFIEEILMTAAHVTLYEFNIDSNQWSRKDVEGSLFVVKRNTQPRFQFIVMNRRNTDNLVENVLGDFEFEIQIPYLLYRNASQEVNGIWFYNSRECEDLASLFSRILNAYAKVPTKPQISASKSEFEELEAVPSMAVMEGPLEPSSASSTATDAREDSSFVNFFSVAMNLSSNAPSGANSGQTYHASTSVPLSSSHAPITAPSPVITSQLQSFPLSTPISNSSVNQYDNTANLLKPYSFFTPPASSSALMMPPNSSYNPSCAQPSLNLQRPYTPMLQPFPPPTPPMSLTPGSVPTLSNGSGISREKVRDALVLLAQDNQFIDIVYQALMKVHHT